MQNLILNVIREITIMEQSKVMNSSSLRFFFFFEGVDSVLGLCWKYERPNAKKVLKPYVAKRFSLNK